MKKFGNPSSTVIYSFASSKPQFCINFNGIVACTAMIKMAIIVIISNGDAWFKGKSSKWPDFI